MTAPSPPASETTTLANGVRLLVLPMPHLETASVAVFVRSGSAHETRALNGISHVVEHMAFKGTATRSCRQINLDAERLGAEVNAHTDKDHTAYYIRGLAPHASRFVHMLGDIVRHSTFPEDEFQRERGVLLHELAEDDDDPMSTAYKLFDGACFGLHAAALPVIGTRRQIERLQRDDLVAYVARQYTGTNVVVAAAGPIDADAFLRDAEAAFGGMPAGQANRVASPAYAGDVRSRRLSGTSQAHLVAGFDLPSLRDDDPVGAVAATLFGEGMSSPLMDELREKRGLVYYAACSADVLDMCGQFVVEASTSPEHLEPALAEVLQLFRRHAEHIDPIDLDRARHQVAMRCLGQDERPLRRLEDAALELLCLGRLRSRRDSLDRACAVTADQLRGAFAAMLSRGVSVALAGALPRGSGDRARELARP